MIAVVNRQAWKPIEDERRITVTTWDDPEATLFKLSYAGRSYPEETLDFDSRYKADEVARALERAFAAGGRRAFANLRDFIGIR